MKSKLLPILLLVVCVSAIGGDDTTRPPTNWQPIMGLSVPNSKAYIDANSMSKISSPNAEYVTGDILLSSDQGKQMKKNNKVVVVKGLVKSILVDCTNGLIAPLVDLYFDVPKPSRQNMPVGMHEYPDDGSQVSPLEKSSPIYKTFCPIYL